MFNGLSKILGCVILGLCLWLGYQYQKIDSLMAKNQTQAQTISQLEAMQQHLQLALEQEQQAVVFQQKKVTQLRKQTESRREKVKVIFKDSPCANTALPDGVVEQLHD